MTLVTLAEMNWAGWMVGLTTVLFLAVCVIMVLTVLIQKPQGGGLASAFGGSGAGSGQTAFGAKTGDALTVFTIIVFVVYLGFAVALNFAMKPSTGAAPAPTDSQQPAGQPAGQPAAGDQPADKPADQPATTPATQPAPTDAPKAPESGTPAPAAAPSPQPQPPSPDAPPPANPDAPKR